MKCFISGIETTRNFAGTPVAQEVLEFARKYRDAMKLKNVRGVLIAFNEMKKFGHTWETIKIKLVDELKAKGILFSE